MVRIMFFIVFLCSIIQESFGQSDTSFWFVAPEVSSGGSRSLDEDIVLKVVTYGSASTVTVSQPAGGGMPPMTMTIPPDSFYTFNLTNWLDQIETKPPNQVRNFGLKISASQPVSAYYEVVSGGIGNYPPNNPEAFVLKGSPALGTEFYIPSQNLLPNDNIYSPTPTNAFDIVATENNTTVTIVPSNNIVGHPQVNGAFTIALGKGQVYSATAESMLAADHLGGSKVTSDKPIAVTVKDDLLNGSYFGNSCADLTGDQILPTNFIGTEYIAIKGLLAFDGDYLFITATQNNTQVYKDGNSVPIATLSEGQIHSFPIVGTATYITTSAPAYAWQLSGSGCEVGATILPKLQCTGSDKVAYVRSSNFQLYLNLLTRAGNQNNFQLNGNSINGSLFSPVPGTGGDWFSASLFLPLSEYPQGRLISVLNSTGNFHMSAIDINGGGSSYAYFSNYGDATVTVSGSPDPACIGDQVQLDVNSVPGATYSWAGPNGFTSALQNPVISGVSLSDAGIYSVAIDHGTCHSTGSFPLSVDRCADQCMLKAGYSINFDSLSVFNFWATGIPSGGVYTWNFGDGTAPVSTNTGSASHQYTGPGSYHLVVTYVTPEGVECEKKVRVCVPESSVPDDDNGISLNSIETPFGTLYPNPTSTEVFIPINEDRVKDLVNIIVYTIEGKKIFERNVRISKNQSIISLPVRQLVDGSYFCEIKSKGIKVVRKFVKLTQ